jgi:hypothetical protein
MQISNFNKLGFASLSSGSLATLFLAVLTPQVAAQVTIQSSGTISGTIQLPSFNPNFNNQITYVNTDSNGTFYRNIGTKNNPNLVPIYTSKYTQIITNKDGSLGYQVRFLGIPVVSFDALIKSPALVSGEFKPYTYQGKLPGVKIQGAVQNEFSIAAKKTIFDGIVFDLKTGKYYQGQFYVDGEGPQYYAANAGDSPTVFDFKSDYNPTTYNPKTGVGSGPKPTVTSYKMTNSPLVRLTITPIKATEITLSSNVTPSGETNPSTPSTPPTTPTTYSLVVTMIFNADLLSNRDVLA